MVIIEPLVRALERAEGSVELLVGVGHAEHLAVQLLARQVLTTCYRGALLCV